MRSTYDVLAVSRALSPITHNSGSEGNETLIQREPVTVDGRTVYVPVLTGNALRHRMVRAPGARWLVERWDIAGKLSVPQLQMLFHGGALTQSSATESLRRIKDYWRILPLGRVLGGCLPDMIIGGTLSTWRGTLACAENESRIASLLPAGYEIPGRLLPAQRVVGHYQYVRADARKTCADLADGEQDGPSGQMIYSGQAVNAGAVFVHGFRLREAEEVDLGALLLSLSIYCAEVATIGGMSGRGHGMLETFIDVPGLDDWSAPIKAYVDHVDSMREEGLAWFEREFSSPAKPTKKARATKKAAKKVDDKVLVKEADGLF